MRLRDGERNAWLEVPWAFRSDIEPGLWYWSETRREWRFFDKSAKAWRKL